MNKEITLTIISIIIFNSKNNDLRYHNNKIISSV